MGEAEIRAAGNIAGWSTQLEKTKFDSGRSYIPKWGQKRQ